MNRSSRVRLTVASVAFAAATLLAGCQTDGSVDLSSRALTPISPKLLAEIEQKNMDKQAPILVRIFKEEAELEVWKKDRTGHFALLKTYPVCRWSGELGPKVREGDRQAPEGFYMIGPAQMNPKSQYYLAFNIGYPNAYDRAWGRTGGDLMIHGDCSSRGCYAMTDEQIAEIYALGREAFFGGQRAFQVQAYPFRMTPANLARHRNNPNLAFWKMLKRGNDHFEVTRLEPRVDVCERKYVFDARSSESFSPSGKCPAYEVPADILTAVNERQREDEYQTAELVSRGAATSPIRTGNDGGTNPAFLANVDNQEPGSVSRTIYALNAPRSLPRNVVPPRPVQETASASATPRLIQTTAVQTAPAAAPRAASPLAKATTSAPRATTSVSESTGTVAAAKTAAPTKTVPPAKPHVAARPAPSATPANQHPKPEMAAAPAPKATTAERPANTASLAPSSTQDSMPMAPAGSFESRWQALTNRGRF